MIQWDISKALTYYIIYLCVRKFYILVLFLLINPQHFHLITIGKKRHKIVFIDQYNCTYQM